MGNFLGGDSKQEGGCNPDQHKVEGKCVPNVTNPLTAPAASQEGGRRRRRRKSRKRKSRNKRKKSRSKRRKRKRSRRRR